MQSKTKEFDGLLRLGLGSDPLTLILDLFSGADRGDDAAVLRGVIYTDEREETCRP